MVTRATSPRRVAGVSRSASKAASVATAAVVRTTRLWLALDSVPAGASKSASSSTSRTCASVRPRLASATGSMSTRKISARSPKSCTSATPGTEISRSSISSWTSVVSSCTERRGEVTPMRMTGFGVGVGLDDARLVRRRRAAR